MAEKFNWNSVFDGTVRSKDSIVEKIRKLQALSGSSNEHEAALAAAKMQELLFKHNISIGSLADPSEFIKHKQEFGGGKNWAKELYVILCQTNFCRPVIEYNNKAVYAIGRRENVEVVNSMFDWLQLRINYLATAGYSLLGYNTGEHAKTWKNGFRLGAVSVISKRLRMQKEADITKIQGETIDGTTGMELIKRMDNQLTTAVRDFFPNLGHGHRGFASNSHSQGFSAGQKAGSRMALRDAKGYIG